ncbi:MAG: hypothetical protein KDB88_13080 [Flavobacteriales bacterium]|nr:hypothetical protein [Flavobacteriales bacterium]
MKERSTLGIGSHAWGVFVAMMLFGWGMWSFPYALFQPENLLIPGDLGDARFNNYILEHFHRYATGKVEDYWSAPFMYPRENVIAHSDNLLGTAPLYSLFRSMGRSVHGAFQTWILALIALNFWAAFLAFRGFRYDVIIAAVGAFIFAFGIHQLGHLSHVQMLPRFMMPIALLAWWRVLQGVPAKWWFLTVLAVVYQFWCGMYLGFILCYGLVVLTVAHALVQRRFSWLKELMNTKRALTTIGAIGVGGILLLPLASPYLYTADQFGPRTMVEVWESIPRPISYFTSDPAAISWRDLSWHAHAEGPTFWLHAHFMGAVIWVGVFIGAILLLRRSSFAKEEHRPLVWLVALALSVLLCIRIGDFTTYGLVHGLPGFSALRSIDRFVQMQALFFILIMMGPMERLFQRDRVRTWLSLALPLLVVLDHRIAPEWTARWNKEHSDMAVATVLRHMQEQYDGSSPAIAWCPVRAPIASARHHGGTIAVQLDAMFAAQRLGVPLVNGYSGNYPSGFSMFFEDMDRPSLSAWLEQSGSDTQRIQPMDNIGWPVEASMPITLWTEDGRSVRLAPTGLLDTAFTYANLSASYTRITLANGRHLFLASNGLFVSADLEHNGELRADAPAAGDFCLFTMIPREGEAFSLQAGNGRYVVSSGPGEGLRASADSLDQALWFWTGELPDGVK